MSKYANYYMEYTLTTISHTLNTIKITLTTISTSLSTIFYTLTTILTGQRLDLLRIFNSFKELKIFTDLNQFSPPTQKRADC